VSTVAGAELDRVDLVDGALTFKTGTAELMFASKRALGLDDAGVYTLMSDWSNGYVQAKAEGDG
jgi:hypothetical protein